MNNRIFNNPLTGISVGSTISGNNLLFSPSILKSNITQMISQTEVIKFMTGQSRFVYSDKLNQSTIGISGAYGISGISKLTAGLSAYVSNTSASSNKSINVNYNVAMLSGIEYIDFDDLNTENILNSLKSGPKELSLEVLDKFNAAKRSLDKEKNQKNFHGDYSHKTKELLDIWAVSLQEFITKYGDGVVAGIIWGGLGNVSMSMTSTQYENNWKYGGNAEFTYSGIGTSISATGSYDGSQTNRDSNITVSCSAWASGSCVKNQVEQWFSLVSGKSFNEIANIKLLEQAPSNSSVSAPPFIPDFQKPKSDPKIKDKLEDITPLNDITEFSIASAYRKAKTVNNNLTEKEFKKIANNKVNIDQLIALKLKIKHNDIDVLALMNLDQQPLNSNSHNTNSSDDHIDLSTLENPIHSSKQEAYCPMGAWIINWSDIFPWMSTGYLNEISDTKEAQKLLKKQCMMQDLLTLSSIYYTLESCKIDLKFCGIKSAQQIADSFISGLGKLKSTLNKDNVIQETFNHLSDDAKTIYSKWNEIRFLRNAELGLGLLIDNTQSVTEKVIRVDTFPYRQTVYKAGYCGFGNNNHSAFGLFLKLLPLIGVDRSIYAFGPSSMILKNTLKNEITFTKGGITAIKFTANQDNKVLESGHNILIPIPYSAAENIHWLGQGLSSSISSISFINNNLKKLQKELNELNMCSFSNSSWDKNWTYLKPYNLRSLNNQYIGLIDKIGNIFS